MSCGRLQSIETTNYVEAQLRVLPRMAKEANLETLSYLIEMAALEAAATVHTKARRVMQDAAT